MNSETVVQPRSNGSKPIRVLMADPDESLQPCIESLFCRRALNWSRQQAGWSALPGCASACRTCSCSNRSCRGAAAREFSRSWARFLQLATVPVMVLTSCRDPRLLEAVARFPVSDYQLKPLAPDRLAGRLRTILAHPKLRFTLAEQNGRLECSIARRTGGRVRDLRVETVDGRVIVHGRSDSHHVKQLALAAVLEAFEASEIPIRKGRVGH